MCSNNFFKTSYIIEHELKPALRRKKNGSNQLILPIIIDRCKWTFENEEINLGRFAGFPYKGKPVTDFKNWNDAWYVTNWFLETIIRKELNNDYEPSSWNCWGIELKSIPSDIQNLLERQIKGHLDNN